MLERVGKIDEPRVEARPFETKHHGIALPDEFAWLKAKNWQDVMRDPSVLDPEIRAYLDAENAHANASLTDTVALQDKLFAEMKGRIKEDDSTVPDNDGPYAYYVRYRQGGQHPLVCRKPREGGDEHLMLDGDALAKDLAYFQLGATRHAPNHRLMAWSADINGSEFYGVRVRDLSTGNDLEDIVPDVSGGVVWTHDSSAFYYVRLDPNHQPAGIFRHRIGDDAINDVKVLQEAGAGLFMGVSELQSGQYADLSLNDHETSETWILDLADPNAMPRQVAPLEDGVQYDVEHHPDLFGQPTLLMRTNADGAEDFKIVTAPLDNPGRAQWRDFIPHRPGVYLLSFTVLADWLIRLEREDGLPRVVVRQLSSGEEHVIAFDEEAYSLGMEVGYEFVSDELRYGYSSMTTPSEVWDYNLKSRARVMRKRQEIPSGHDPAAYVTRRVLAPTPDGETVPISLLYRRDTPIDGTAPGLIYGYGAYGMSMPASFSANRLSLVDRGFVYAIAHIRGGTDKGWRWYREGKLAKKTNTFADFIAATEFIGTQRFVAKDKIVAHGGSAGGMLMGAIANLRPDLYAGIVAEVPFVDVLNTMLDETLPLTPPEWPEWGNPIESVEAYKTIAAYSPYDNVKAQDYPAMLVLAGLTDPRVTYWEPAKWVARLRKLRTNRNMLAFRTNMDAGHGGAAGRFDRLKEVALGYAFAVKATGGKLS